MGEENKMVLAMYDVRGKQEFIFRTNKLQEIVGGSWIIRDIFEDYLYEAAKQGSINEKGIYRYNTGDPFKKEEMRKHFKDGYIGEVIYEGGGNFLLVFKDESTFEDVTRKFTTEIIKNIGTLHVLGTCVEVSDDNLTNYKKDNENLYNLHRKKEAMDGYIGPWACLPFSQVDRKTSMPLIDYNDEMYLKEEKDKSIREVIRSKGQLTKESFAKLKKYHEVVNGIKKGNKNDDTVLEIERDYFKKNTDILDEIVEEKGVDSKLAIVYIDGNSMGAKVRKEIEKKEDTKEPALANYDYDRCVNALRDFSKGIQETYIEKGIKAAFKDLVNDPYRIVVYAGDEVNFIVRAGDAFSCAKNYLDSLKEKNEGEDSACAGISIFHSHSSYSDAYRIAEEACESGKKKMKEMDLECASFIDFHFGQGATGITLEEIRKKDNADDIIGRPWLMWSKDKNDVKDVKDVITYDDAEKIVALVNAMGRGNVKGLAESAKKSRTDLEMEINRIYSHQSESDKVKNAKIWETAMAMDKIKFRKLIYDVVLAYDCWFDEGNKEKSNEWGMTNEQG